MRNPLNSWERSDSYPAVDCGKCGIIDREGICHPKEHDCTPYECYAIGDNDKDLMTRLIRGGAPHRKFLRQIFVSVDITAPLYWWKEFDTYKVGTIDILVDLGSGDATAKAWGCDLTYDYVKINGDYRT